MYYFDEYVLGYDINDVDINYKYHHSYRVMENMFNMANSMNLSSDDVYLARVIGLLHDIGRFEQDKLYNSFVDDKIDHGEYGVLFLKKRNFLDKFNISKDDYEVVYKAIFNHNKLQIENGLSDRELLFSKMIRDADKIDILYAVSNPLIKKELREDDSIISKHVEKEFFNNKTVVKNGLVTVNDGLVLMFSFVFDINFKYSYSYLNEMNYYNKLYDRIVRKDLFKKYIDYVNCYIEERIDL